MAHDVLSGELGYVEHSIQQVIETRLLQSFFSFSCLFLCLKKGFLDTGTFAMVGRHFFHISADFVLIQLNA